MIQALHHALEGAPYSESQIRKEPNLVSGLSELTEYHYRHCTEYARILDGAWDGRRAFERLKDVPYLPVSVFKTQNLLSIAAENVRVVLTSSGTTGQGVSRIHLDTDASVLQQRALANCLMRALGKHRLPMLIIDTKSVFSDPRLMSARGAGVLGIMRYGRNHAFALREDLSPDFETVRTFLRELDGQPFFMFGFTFMVWTAFYEQFQAEGLDLSNGTLIHSGGWKKMAARAIDNDTFRSAFKQSFGLTRIFNFYGMVEQIGTIFLEGPGGLLYAPNFADVIIRDPQTWQPAAPGEPGVVQVLSLLPHSYPGHSLLTEDLGMIERIDHGQEDWPQHGVRILGRVPKAELRGCSDVIAAAA